jgi:hypothetical protein
LHLVVEFCRSRLTCSFLPLSSCSVSSSASSREGRRKDSKGHRRFAKFDTRLPLPAAAMPAAGKSKPTPAELRAFMARVAKVARLRAPKERKDRRKTTRAAKGHEEVAIYEPPR